VRLSGVTAALGRAALIAGCALAGTAAVAQPTIDNSEHLASDRPEAWGMKFAAAVTAFAPIDAMRPLLPGTVELGFEAGSIPSLSEDERRIGFGGTKVEEIDRGPLFGRLRARFGLPRGFDLALGLVPPVDVDGLEPLLFSAALAHPLHAGRRLRLGAWLGATTGRLRGDITCGASAVAGGDDPVANPLGCTEPSEDVLELDVATLGLGAAWVNGSGRVEPYASLALHHLDGRFEVRARYADLEDRSVLSGEDWFWSYALGLASDLAERWRLAGEFGYTPLDLRRFDEPRRDQSVWNARLVLSYRLR